MRFDDRSNGDLTKLSLDELELKLAGLSDDYLDSESEEEQELIGRLAQEIDDEISRRNGWVPAWEKTHTDWN